MDNLITKAKMRDADAFTSLMQSQMQNMYKTARAILDNDEDAADAISETILNCWEKIGQLKQDHYFRTWLTRILINNCKEYIPVLIAARASADMNRRNRPSTA